MLCFSPVTRQGTPADYANYPLLCQALRTAFDAAGHTDWLITVATSINQDKLAQGYDMAAMAPHINWFNMMSYDIYGSWSLQAGANADLQYIKNTMNYIYGLGIARDKLVLGLAGYGRSMTLSSTSCITDGCPVSGAGLTGCHTEAGNLPYFQIDETYIQTGDYGEFCLPMSCVVARLVQLRKPIVLFLVHCDRFACIEPYIWEYGTRYRRKSILYLL